MHNRDFYVQPGSREDPPRELMNILRKGSELETLEDGPLLIEFQNRIRQRAEILTLELTKSPSFVLELRRDGRVRKTKPFANKWRRKEEYWELDYADYMSDQPASTAKPQFNKRRKLKPTKGLVSFPNLREPQMASPIPATLASLAGVALQMATNELEDHEMADESMAESDEQQCPMFVSDALAVTTPRSDDDQSRSVTPEHSIAVGSLLEAAEGNPNTSPGPSSVREQSWDALRTTTSAKDPDGVRDRDSPNTGSQDGQDGTSPLSDLSSLRSSIFQTPTRNQIRPGSTSESPWVLDDSSDDELVADRMIIDEPGHLKYLKIEPVPDALYPVPTVTDQQPPLHSASPLFGETASASPMQQTHHDQMTSIPQQLQSSLLNTYPPRVALLAKLADNSAVQPKGNERPADISVPPASSSPIDTTASSEPAVETPRPPTIPAVSNPTSPPTAFGKFLSHYGDRGSGPEVLTSSKKTQPVNSSESVVSPKERIRAETRAEVRAQAAEWEEIRSREKKSKSRTKSPPQASTATQEEMPPPPLPTIPQPPLPIPPGATELVRTGSTSIAPRFINTFMADFGPMGTSDHTNQSSISKKLRAPSLPANLSSTDAGHPSGDQHLEPSNKSSAAGVNDRTPSASAPESPHKQARRPLLVPNLTKPISPMVSKIRTSTPAQTSNPKTYWSPFRTSTDAPTSPSVNTSPPRAAQAVSQPEKSAVSETSSASVALETPSEGQVIPPPKENTFISSTASFSHVEVEPAPVPAALQPQQAVPTPALTSTTPNPSVNREPSMSSAPPAPISRSSTISMGVAAATAKTLAAQTDEFLKKGGGDRLCTDNRTSAQDATAREAAETGRDLPQPRSGAYAHVPERIPFSATPSEEEIAAMQQILQQPHDIRALPESYANQERSMVKSSLHNSGVKTLEIVIESASEVVSVENGFSFDVVLNNTLSGFFSFYSKISKAPLESFQRLTFMPTWPNSPTTYATKQMGELGFKKMKKLLQRWYNQAQKADPHEMDFQIVVQRE